MEWMFLAVALTISVTLILFSKFTSPKVLTPNERARGLLLRIMTPEQRRDYRQTGSFLMTGSSGRRYSLGSGFIWEFDGDSIWCVRPDNYFAVPTEDTVVAQMLHLATDDVTLLTVIALGRRW